MAIDIPADWPPSGWSETPPQGHLWTINSKAPAGTDPTLWKLAMWESVREISSSALPGQVRHKTGLSVGTARALVKRDGNDYPWKRGLVYELSGQDAEITLAPEFRTEIPAGQFRVSDISGNLTTLGVQVELNEKQIEGKDSTPGILSPELVSLSQFEDSAFDPAWLLSELARQIGYGVTANPGENGYNPILDVPLQGSLAPAHPTGLDFKMNDIPDWTELDGYVALLSSEETGTVQFVRYAVEKPLISSYTITADVQGNVEFEFQATNPTRDGEITLSLEQDSPFLAEDEVSVEVSSRGANGSFNSGDFATFLFPNPTPERPHGLQAQIEFLSSNGLDWTSVRFRVRRGSGAAWSAWTTHPMANSPGTVDEQFDIWLRPNSLGSGGSPARLTRVSIVDTDSLVAYDEDNLWAVTPGQKNRIHLEPLFGTDTSYWIDPDLSVWSAMQAIVEAWQAALITDVYGDLRVLNRFTLTGVGSGAEQAIDIGKKFEDLPWEMNSADQADRLVLTYRPAVTFVWEFVSGPGGDDVPIVFDLQEVLEVPPGTKEYFFSLDYIDAVYLHQIPFTQKGSANANLEQAQLHEWDAHRYNNGTGARMAPNTDIGLRIERITSSTWKIVIVNRTAEPFYMVDETGTPWLKIRSAWFVDQRQQNFIERGLSASESENEIKIDVDSYVQTDADANELADFIWGRVNYRSWRATTINTVPDYRLDLGDVVEIVHSRTGMRSNALITKVEMSGETGSLTQRLDLILIPPTWEDFNEAWSTYEPNPPGSWADFNALWDDYTWADFNRTPTATTVAQIEEGM